MHFYTCQKSIFDHSACRIKPAVHPATNEQISSGMPLPFPLFVPSRYRCPRSVLVSRGEKNLVGGEHQWSGRTCTARIGMHSMDEPLGHDGASCPRAQNQRKGREAWIQRLGQCERLFKPVCALCTINRW